MSLLMVGDNPNLLENINKLSLSEKQLGEVEWVHTWLKDNYQAIFGKLNYEIIGQEVDVSREGSEGYLDFLAIDIATGDTVVIECKRDDFKHRDLIGQALEYAAGISRFSLEALNRVYCGYSHNELNSIESLFAKYNGSIPEINKKQKIVLVIQNSNRNEGTYLRLKALCRYMRAVGSEINILEMKWYSRDKDVQKPKKGDIVEFNLVWETEAVIQTKPSLKGRKIIAEDEFLLDKSDIAIGLYNCLLSTINTDGIIQFKRRPNSQWITFYGKSKAFLIVIFLNEYINIRLRSCNNYENSILTKLPEETDKLSKSDGFLYSFDVYSTEDINKVIPGIIDSYNYNS